MEKLFEHASVNLRPVSSPDVTVDHPDSGDEMLAALTALAAP
jgi:hypothetical protein